jgi:hypothetical protein
MRIEKYTFGVGDRFAHQAKAQLAAFRLAEEHGLDIIPVWNKSNREHLIVGSEPASVRAAAFAAVRDLSWNKPWHVDADHINLTTVGRFIAPSDFYTLDVAQFIGSPAAASETETFLKAHPELTGSIEVPGIAAPLTLTRESVGVIASKYLLAVKEAGRIYRSIADRKGADNFVTEVSMDETDAPQTPPELLIILAAIADEQIPIQTIAPKFTGRFNKGVDYVGDVAKFEAEFSDDIAVIAFAVARYRLRDTLKLSVHSGSDKFSLYRPMRDTLRRTGAGLHLKTAGTTWLEELIGLAEADGEGLALAKEIYIEAYGHSRELCEPYASVIDIDFSRLPEPGQVSKWTAGQYTGALRHDPNNPAFNPNLRQLLHVGYKVAAKMGSRYLDMLRQSEEPIARNVTENIWARHIRPLFG